MLNSEILSFQNVYQPHRFIVQLRHLLVNFLSLNFWPTTNTYLKTWLLEVKLHHTLLKTEIIKADQTSLRLYWKGHKISEKLANSIISAKACFPSFSDQLYVCILLQFQIYLIFFHFYYSFSWFFSGFNFFFPFFHRLIKIILNHFCIFIIFSYFFPQFLLPHKNFSASPYTTFNSRVNQTRT